MSETMVERVAKAIDECPEWPAKTYRLRMARAAIEAMMPPTEAMLKAAADLKSPCVKYSTLYNLMIRAALATLPGEG